jgi:prophage antirepressor-like protein|nr:MAG TPA: repressor domain protein [Caudoviricetes sp.]
MSNIQIFNYQSNEVRTVELNGEPWFVLKDVCAVLGLASPHKVAERLDEDERNQIPLTDSMGRQQESTVINESGLYNVILRSDKPEAKPFRKWVTSEVLPSIRKNGGYIAGQEQLTPQELMAKALLVANKTLADREARISELTVQNNIMAPKAEYFDELVDRNMLTSFRDTAKELGIKPKAFVDWLLAKKFIYRDQKNKLMPREDKNNGLFEIKEAKNDKTQWCGVQTLITPKGRETFRLLYL